MFICINKRSQIYIFIFCLFVLMLHKRFGEDMDLIASDLPAEERKWLCSLLGNVELTLLYKASVHGYQASIFHQRCDRQGPTLLVAYNRSGYIFGGYTSVEYAQSGQHIRDEEAFLFSFQGNNPVCFNVSSGCNARLDNTGGPNFGQKLYFCYNNQPAVYDQSGQIYDNAFTFSSATLYGNDTQLTECEVYKVEQSKSVIRIIQLMIL